MFLNLCEESNILSVILYLKEIINVIQIIIPIILIIMCAVDLGKIMLNPEDKKQPKIFKRMVAAVAVFFIPTILNIVLDAAGQQNFMATDCWTNANTSTINKLRVTEQENKEKEKQARAEQVEAAKQLEREKEANREAQNQQNAPSTTLLKENGTDGKVDVIDGVFYKPSSGTSGAAGTKGSGPYGYNIYFYNRLKTFIDAAKEAGHDIQMSTSEYGAWRPLDKQQYFWDCYNHTEPPGTTCTSRNLAARPGTSNHGWGIASDLSYGNGKHGRQNALYWAHDNASKYGLSFPLCANIRGSCKENWHIEPAVLKKK